MRAAAILLGAAFDAGRGRLLLFAALRLVAAARAPVSAVAFKLLIDAAFAGSGRRVLTWSLALALAWGTATVVENLAGLVGHTVFERAGLALDARVVELTGQPDGIEHYERPEYLDELTLLRMERGQFSLGALTIVSGVSTAAQAIAAVVLLATVHPLLALLPLIAGPSLVAASRAEAILARAREASAARVRLGEHLFTLSTTAGPAKELRIFGLTGEIARRYSEAEDEVVRTLARAEVRSAAVHAIGALLFALTYSAAVVFVAWEAVNGRASAGDVVLVIALAGQVVGQTAAVVSTARQASAALRTAGRFAWLSDYARTARRRARPRRASPPRRLERHVVLDGVSFAYPGAERPALRDVSATLAAGSTVRVVGPNGAGKSTLVKLLCAFYEPTAGRILVDDVDLASFDATEWRARVTSVFQDFGRFELVAREAVGIGDLDRIEDADAVLAAVERASARDVVDALPHGLETPLGRTVGGVDLSHGEWQKLAVARAMLRPAPLLVLLDEPTASLDALSEHALLGGYAEAARRVASTTGGVTVLVSHRASALASVDRVLVLDAGSIVETGTHEELLRAGGLYAELYDIQARAYR